ncbi:hypothetical protein EVA_10822 [gut metagenome]|uniref:Uncharacterized protein n=1 Tax=gut metagenome TaxID=749906 RepID=J9G1K3_9ZZZZ
MDAISSAKPLTFSKIDNTLAGKGVNTGQSNVAHNGKIKNKTFGFTVFCYKANPALMASSGLSIFSGSH